MPVTRNRGIPSPTIAHEGNPRATDLVVSGTLDGNAFIRFLPPNVITATPPPSPEPVGAASDQTCPTVVQWPTNRDAIPIVENTNQSGGSITVFTDQFPFVAPFTPANTTWMVMSLESAAGCCGCSYTPVQMIEIPTIIVHNRGSAETPDYRYERIYPVHDISAGFTVLGISQSPYAGIACFVQDGSTVTNFTGYVLAANYSEGVTKLMKYYHQSLCAEGEILATIASVPQAADDLMYISVFTDPNASSLSDTIWELTATIENSGGTAYGTPIDLQIHDSLMDVVYTHVATAPDNSTVSVGDRHNRANIGVVAIGATNQVGGVLALGASFNKFGVRSVCDSFTHETGGLS